LTAQYARWFEIFAGLYPALRELNRRLRETF
jgi:hypothetical protein